MAAMAGGAPASSLSSWALAVLLLSLMHLATVPALPSLGFLTPQELDPRAATAAAASARAIVDSFAEADVVSTSGLSALGQQQEQQQQEEEEEQQEQQEEQEQPEQQHEQQQEQQHEQHQEQQEQQHEQHQEQQGQEQEHHQEGQQEHRVREDLEHTEASQRHARKLHSILKRTKSKPSPSEPMSTAEALARVGDGRIYVVGHPEGPPAPKVRVLTPPPHSSKKSGSGSLSSASKVKAAAAVSGSPSVTVNVQVNRPELNYKISPLIYGVNEYGYSNYDTVAAAIADAGIRVVRRGGNIDTRFNWLYDTRNTGADWYFENYPQDQKGNMTSIDQLFQITKQAGADALFTIPILGWLPKARDRSCSFSIRKYGNQTGFDPWGTDCGSGQLANKTTITWNDVRDTAALFGPEHQTKFVQTLVSKWGRASQGGVRYYCLDNEPVWWSYNHRDIHPRPSTYDEILERNLAYAAAVRAADPTAVILGPVSGGWSDVFFSITDMQSGWGTRPWKFWVNPVDRYRHGNVPHLQWYLQQMAAYEMAYGTRLLDIVDIHAYVAGDAGSDATDAVSQANRVASTRTYWDPTFKCNTTICGWVDPVNAPDGVPRLLVRVQEMIDSTYPGLGLALTEYSFGGNNDASGAVAQAEALGIFGKLGLAMATVFSGPTAGTTVYKAFKMFGNYDSRGARFGSLGVSAVTSNYTAVSSYAAVDSGRRVLTILLINLTPASQSVTVNLLDVSTSRPIRYFCYDSVDLTTIRSMPSFPPSSSLSYTFTGYSLNMLEVSLAG